MRRVAQNLGLHMVEFLEGPFLLLNQLRKPQQWSTAGASPRLHPVTGPVARLASARYRMRISMGSVIVRVQNLCGPWGTNFSSVFYCNWERFANASQSPLPKPLLPNIPGALG